MSRYLLVILGCIVAGACSDPPDTASAQLTRGEEVYRTQCYSCHDVDGNIGVDLSTRVLRYYETASALLSYTRLAMPYSAPGSLTQEEYLDVTAYLVALRGLATEVLLTSGSADSVSFSVRAGEGR